MQKLEEEQKVGIELSTESVEKPSESHIDPNQVITNESNPDPEEHQIKDFRQEIDEEVENTIEDKVKFGFIKKVYGILACQIFITVLLCSCSFITVIRTFMISHVSLVYYACAILTIQSFGILCFHKVLRKVPYNYILLSLWTFLMGYSIAVCCACCDSTIVIISALATLLVTVSLSVYACLSDTHYSAGGACIVGLFSSFLTFWFFFSAIPAVSSIYCSLGLLTYSFYIVFDTQMLFDKLDYGYNVDDYILASLNIYLDIIQIFLYILNLLSRLNGR